MYLFANPQFYDYLHSINLDKNNKCELCDGAGQCVSSNFIGTFKLNNDLDNDGSIDFTINTKNYAGLFGVPRKFNPNDESVSFTVNFTVDNGLFVFRDEIVWNLRDKNDWPISIFNRRYVFDTDPFLNIYNRENNLFFMLEGDKEDDSSLKYFYRPTDRVNKKFKELTPDELQKLNEYDISLKEQQMKIREKMGCDDDNEEIEEN